jgi:rhamnulokinase
MAVLAVDLGAGSGRVFAGRFDGRTIELDEIHRFPNDPVLVGERLQWDMLRLLHEIKQGFAAAKSRLSEPVASFGIDSWGLDFGLLDETGELIGNPAHYRDRRNLEALDRTLELVPRRELFERTGSQILAINSLFQLTAIRGTSALERARSFLMMPDLFRYFLTGERTNDWTIASTSQCLSIETGDWDRELLNRLGLPAEIFQPVTRGPVFAGELQRSVREELGLDAIPAVVVGEHDTASAVAAVPADGDFAYISCGTWALVGTETARPVVDDRAFGWNFTNEGGLDGSYRLLKNVMGLWLVESCRRVWRSEGEAVEFEHLAAAVEQAEPFAALIDPDLAAFLNPPSMPETIRGECRRTGQPAPETIGAMLRCVLESLALKFRFVLDCTEALTGKRFNGLHIVGGGAKNRLLCQFTANAIGRPVWAGPVEATSIGNALAQLMASGAIASLAEGRAIVRRSFPVETHEPRETSQWHDAYARFLKLIELPIRTA